MSHIEWARKLVERNEELKQEVLNANNRIAFLLDELDLVRRHLHHVSSVDGRCNYKHCNSKDDWPLWDVDEEPGIRRKL